MPVMPMRAAAYAGSSIHRLMFPRTLVGDDGVPAVLHHLGGHGQSLLSAHGPGLNAGMWAAVVPHLVERFHCYGLDFRGHGASRPPSEPVPVDRQHFIDEALAAVDALGGQ